MTLSHSYLLLRLFNLFYFVCSIRGLTASFLLQMEKLARRQYMKKKDPKACLLLYIALNRLQVLAGLFKISKDEKDKPLAGFLFRNFQVPDDLSQLFIFNQECNYLLETWQLPNMSDKTHTLMQLLCNL